MNQNHNPYAAPSATAPVSSANSRPRFLGRSIFAMVLAAATATTGILTSRLWSTGAIDLGRYGILFLFSLGFAAVILVIVAKFYANGSRSAAIGLMILVLCIILSVVLLALHDAGLLSPY